MKAPVFDRGKTRIQRPAIARPTVDACCVLVRVNFVEEYVDFTATC